MASNLDLYRREIFNFLRTVTIKFEPFAYLMGEKHMNAYGLTNPHGKWNPYYIHLSGEYTSDELASGDVMHVYTVEHELPEDIILTKNVRDTNPKTYALYHIPNAEYEHLEEKYPKHVGLLRCMIYPVKDIDTAIAAPNLSLLAYDASLLDVNEREDIVKYLKDFLEMVRHRWWIEEYTYEDMYAVTFWAMLWQLLPMVLLGRRFENIKTPYVHPFHIWEYLKSKNLGDYRDILTHRQSLWLYRNIDYILENKGKASNLTILAKNLLEDAFVSLHYIDMQQDISNFEEDLHAQPQFIFNNYETDKEEKIKQLDDLNPMLYEAGLSDSNTPEYVTETANDLGTTGYNQLPTKYLELKKDRIDTSSLAMMTTFFLHSLVYRYSEGKLEYSVTISDPYTGASVKLYINDMIVLLYYAICRSIDLQPTYIPTQVRVRVPYRISNDVQLTETIKYADNTYNISELVNVEGVLNLIPWDSRVFVSRDDFAEFINKQFDAHYFLFKQMEQSHKYLYHKALRRMLDDITVNRILDIHLSGHTEYATWIDSIPVVSTLIKQYEDIVAPIAKCNAYRNLSRMCYDTIFDIADGKTGVNTVKKMNAIYDAVRELFIGLCSYNITFVDSERDNVEYLRVEEPDFLVGLHTSEYVRKNASFFNLIILIVAYLSGDNFKSKITMSLNDIEVPYSTQLTIVNTSFYKALWPEYYRKFTMISRMPVRKVWYTKITEQTNHVRTKFVLHAGMDKSCTRVED